MGRALAGAQVVALIGKRAQLVAAADGTPLGKPVGGSGDADWALAGDRLLRLDDGVVAVIDAETGKPRHQVKTPGARRLIAVGAYVFAWGKPDVHCLHAREDTIAPLWSAPCGHVHNVFVLGERAVIGDVRGGKGATRILALDGGRELAAFPGRARLADDRGLVLDAGGAFIVTDPDGKTLWRAGFNQLRPDALLADVIVANQTQPDLLAGPEVVLERATGKLRVALPEEVERRRPAPFTSTQKVVAVADDTIYLAEGVLGRAQPICAFDPQGQLRWTVELTIGAGHHINLLYAGDRQVLAIAGSGRVSCLRAP